MAAGVRGIGTRVAVGNNVGNPTNLALTLPTRQNGDLLLAISVCRSITAVPTCSAGWTAWPGFPKKSATASGGQIAVFYRFADGSEANPTVTWTGVTTGTSGDSSQGVILVVSEPNATPSDVTPPNPTDASAANPSIPTISTATADALAIGISVKISDTAQTGTIANSFVEQGDFHTTSGTGNHMYIATRAMAAPGATGASTVTESNGTAARCLSVSLAVKAKVFVYEDAAVSFGGAGTLTVDGVVEQVTPPPFNDPSDLSGLAMWFDADSLGLANDAAVTSWADLSGQGRDLTTAAAPTFKTNQLNGKPGVLFDGGDDYLTHLAGASFVTGKEITVFAVYRRLSNISNARVMAFNATDDIDYQTPSWCIYEGGSSDRIAPYSNGELAIHVPHPTAALLMTTWFGADDTHNLRIDRAPSSASQTSTAQMGVFTFQTKRFTLGMGWLGGPSSGGNLVFHEVVIYDRELTSTERGQVEDYLNAKWFTAPAGGIKDAAISLAGAASLAVTPRRRRRAAITMTGAAAISVTPRRRRRASVSLNGVGTLVPNPRRRRRAATVLSGAATLTTAAKRRRRAATLLQGVASFVVSGIDEATGVVYENAAVSLTGTGSLVVNPRRRRRAAVALSGVGTLISAPRRRRRAATTLVGVGTLTTVPRRRRRASLNLTGTGMMITAAKRRRLGRTTLIGVATFVTSGVVGAAPIIGAVNLIGRATLTVQPRRRRRAAITLTATGILQPKAKRNRRSAATLVGSASLAIKANRRRRGATVLSGAGVMQARPLRSRRGAIILTASGLLVADGTTAAAIWLPPPGMAVSTTQGARPTVVLITNGGANASASTVRPSVAITKPAPVIAKGVTPGRVKVDV